MTEFELIRRYFQSQTYHRPDVIVPIGDDCAILAPPPHQQLAISLDTLVSGVHFFSDMPAYDLGYKALSVNLSDLAAMGAEPAWFTLALTLPAIEETWLQAFSRGLFDLAARYQLALVGGDTTHGPCSITIQVQGFVPPEQALKRQGAQPGDDIYITGSLGDAGFGLNLLKTQQEAPNKDYFLSRLYRPTPRIEVGQALRQIASAAIDISDGLAADLFHILESSGVGATIFLDNLPLSTALRATQDEKIMDYALCAGEDYELCFTAPPEKKPLLKQALNNITCPIAHIGVITQTTGLKIVDGSGNIKSLTRRGYDHFAPS